MADVNVYKRCTHPHAYLGVVVHVNDVRLASDPLVAQNPQWWVTLTDTEFTDGKHQTHGT